MMIQYLVLTCFHIFMLDVQKYLKDNTPRRISSFPKPTSPSKISVKQSSNIGSHQSPNSGHHPRQLSCVFLISIHCFRAWHKAENEQIFIEWNLPTFISICLNNLLFYFHWVVRPSPSPGWLLTHQPLSHFYSLYFFFIVYYFLWSTGHILYKVLHKLLVGGNKVLSLSKSHISVTLLSFVPGQEFFEGL